MKRILYIFLQFTWGILATSLGFFVFIFALIKRGKVTVNKYGLITFFGKRWGGLSLGFFQFGDNDYGYLRAHEYGHSIQNITWGPLYLFVIAIPSLYRYWLDAFGKLKKPYYAVWFEKQATEFGTRAMGINI